MTVDRLVEGFAAFRARYFEGDGSLFSDLVEHGQHPTVAVVACADSRVSPSVMLQVDPGELFVIRNIANMVPPPGAASDNATVAGLEYAVLALGVRHVVIVGHSHCGGIHALMEGPEKTASRFPHVTGWVSAFEQVRRKTLARCEGDPPDMAARAVETAAIVASLTNLAAYPWVRERVDTGELELHGWYFDMESGSLSRIDAKTGEASLLCGEPSP